MELAETISLPVEPAKVWALLGDANSVSQCIPGAELVADLGDNTFEGRILFVLGPKKVVFSGRVSFENDDAALCGHLTAQGNDASGSTRATGRVDYAVACASETGDGSTLTLVSDVNFLGPLEDFANSGGVHVGKRILAEFASCLREKLETTEVEGAALIRAKPLGIFSLVVGTIWAYAKKLFDRLFRRRRTQSAAE